MFITFEGPEGAGKSTVLAHLTDELRSLGYHVLLTKEPGAGDVGQAIRKLLLDGGELEPRTELFLFLADRSEHISKIVGPALKRGDIVLCDRHCDSTLVYQGIGRGFDIEKLREWNAFATDNLKPDMTILLDVQSEVGLERIRDKNRLDREPLRFHHMVRHGFLQLAAEDPSRWEIIDATARAEDVFRSVLAKVLPKLPPVSPS